MPVDCEVFQGSATITIEHLTGEVKPLETKVGDRIPGGARNLDGRMIVKVCLKCLDSKDRIEVFSSEITFYYVFRFYSYFLIQISKFFIVHCGQFTKFSMHIMRCMDYL